MPIKNKRETVPCALTIAGSDSGGGAGIQADLKTFAAIGVHGTSAITSITAQNPKHVAGVQAVSPEMLGAQIDAIFAELRPKAVKTGMLFEAQLVALVAARLKRAGATLIVDPVMISTSGAKLLKADAVQILTKELLPLADLITPNLDEAAFLLKKPISNLDQLRQAAREFHASYGCAALVKGGHLRGPEAVDFYFDGRTELMLTAKRINGVSTHGTGCTYSAAITAYAALGEDLPEAVIHAKTFISNAIAASQRCGRHYVLNPLWNRPVRL